MLTVIITSFKEPKTIAKAIKCVADKEYSGIPDDFEIIQLSPDDETLEKGLQQAKKMKLGRRFKQIRDPRKGKPYALNLAFEKANGGVFILTDGDVHFGKNAIKFLLEPFKDKAIGGVTGRPIVTNTKDTMMGYYGNLLFDAAHHKRMKTCTTWENGECTSEKGKFFPMSGYILAMRDVEVELPQDLLIDDAFISYMIARKDLKIAYAPEATVFVKYPLHLKDYFKQKIRALGGHIQLNKYLALQNQAKTRTLKDELAYFWFPFSYAKNLKEFFWSLLLYPIRLITWIRIFIARIVLNTKTPDTGWERIESTK